MQFEPFDRFEGIKYKIIDEFDISQIKKEVLNLTHEDWNLDQFRQKYLPPHEMTKSYFINSIPLDWSGNGYPLQRKTNNDNLYNAVKVISDKLETRFKGRVGRTILVNLVAGGNIPEHVDNGYYLRTSHRCHIPIITNESVMFLFGNVKLNMKEGVCYEIDNASPHAVNNLSNFDRIHLIIDIISMRAFK